MYKIYRKSVLHVLCVLFMPAVFVYKRFIHSVFCLTTGPKPPRKWFLHIVRSRASSFKWEYPLLSLRSSSSFLRLLPRLLATSISRFIFPSITFCRNTYWVALERGVEADVGPYLKCLLSIFTQNWIYLVNYTESLPYPVFITIWQVI